MRRLVLIVEGQGDAVAVPALVHRLCAFHQLEFRPVIRPPIRVHRNQIIQQGQLEKYTELASNQAQDLDMVMLFMDADDDCPAQLGPQLLSRMRRVRPERRYAVVLANREYESWLIASDNLYHLSKTVDIPESPESIRGAKEWLRNHLPLRRYSPTTDQLRLTQSMDISKVLTRCSSFERLSELIKSWLSPESDP